MHEHTKRTQTNAHTHARTANTNDTDLVENSCDTVY